METDLWLTFFFCFFVCLFFSDDFSDGNVSKGSVEVRNGPCFFFFSFFFCLQKKTADGYRDDRGGR